MFEKLKESNYRWFVTGAAGFIGSHIVAKLLEYNQEVVGFDNFFSGNQRNLSAVKDQLSARQFKNFRFIEGDIRDPNMCKQAMDGCHIVLHQAAIGSVPLSFENPHLVHDVNVNGFLNILLQSRDANIHRVVYASSSAVYGDNNSVPATETELGNVLSPYALTKKINEDYARIFSKYYGLNLIGLRYFNVFGPRQNPNGAYAAVIPQWITSIQNRMKIQINGDGTTTRDFSFVDNIVAANIAAALISNEKSFNKIYNIADGKQTSLNQLCEKIASIHSIQVDIEYAPFRLGDVMHSMADISLAENFLGYSPGISFDQGLKQTYDWYAQHDPLEDF